MEKVKKSIMLNKNIAEMVKELAEQIGMTENNLISVAVFEYYKKFSSGCNCKKG